MHFILHLELEYLDFILISLRAEILKQFEQEIKEQFSLLLKKTNSVDKSFNDQRILFLNYHH
jgi:hypothetical protein